MITRIFVVIYPVKHVQNSKPLAKPFLVSYYTRYMGLNFNFLVQKTI